MSFADLVRRRRMVRWFREEPVDPEAVRRLVELGRRAPSAGFTQGVSFLVLSDPVAVQGFWEATAAGTSRWVQRMKTAPVLVLVWCDESAYRRRYTEADKGWSLDDQPWVAPYWYVDAGMAAENILLGALDEGLGACFFGVPADRVDAVRARFGVPAEQLSVGVISLGHPEPEEDASGSPLRRDRRELADQVHHDRWESS